MYENLKEDDAPSHVFEFYGDGGNYFLICFVNTLLVIVTLGLYTPWALMKCRRYIYENMKLNGQSFAWNATGKSVFLSWLMLAAISIAGLVLIKMTNIFVDYLFLIALALVIPYILVKSFRYQAEMTTLNGMRFGFDYSMMRVQWNMLVLPALLLIALSLVICMLALVFSVDTPGEITFGLIIISLVVFIGFGAIAGIFYSRLMIMVGQGGRFGIHRFNVQINVRHSITSSIIAMATIVPFLLVAGFIFARLVSDIELIPEGEIGANIPQDYEARSMAAQIIYHLGLAVSTSCFIVFFRNHFLGNLTLADGRIRFRSTLTFHGMVYRQVSLHVISAITCGLAYPLLRMWLISWLAQNTYVVGDLDALELKNCDEAIDNSPGSRISRGVMPTFPFI